MGVLEFHRMNKLLNSLVINLLIEVLLVGSIITWFVLNGDDRCQTGGRGYVLLSIIIKGGLVIPYIISMIFITQKRYLSFSTIELITMVIIIPSWAWFVNAILKFTAGSNDWRKHAFFYFIVDFVLFMEALLFFSKLFIVIVVLTFSLLYMYISDFYSKWRTKREGELAYEAVLNDDELKIRKSEVDPDEFCIICMEAFDSNDQITQLSWNIKHLFHADWIAEWVQTHPKWPLCNIPITQN